MTEDLSADLALADSEARESRERVTVDDVMRLASKYYGCLNGARKTNAKAALRTAVAALARAALAPAVPQWMPIEAAPKDGTEVLLSNGTDVSAGHWLHLEGGIHERRDLEGRYIDQDEDEGYDGWIDWSGGMNPKPSHWMPLPAPPGASEQVAPAVPPGWKMVPVEPTPEMVAAMAMTDCTGSTNKVPRLGICGAQEAYEAMIAAAPSAKEPTCPKN